jgi:TolA-binding protein
VNFSFWRWILILQLLAAAPRLQAANEAESHSFDAAAKAIDLTDWPRAEALFAAFAQEFTNSTRLPEAFLYQGEARFKQTNYAGALEILSARLPSAGAWKDHYLFWIGKSHEAQKNYRPAIEAFDNLLKDFPASSRLLEALVSKATAHGKLGEWPRVVELLQQTNGIFQAAARTNAAEEWVPRGYLLLSKALFAQTNYPSAEAALQPLAKLLLNRTPDIPWQRQYLLCQIQIASGRLDEALGGTTALWSLATNAAQPNLVAESAALKGRILEALGRPEEAIVAYTNNFTQGLPAERQREALLRITELSLAQNKLAQAAQALASLLIASPETPVADLAWLTLGELRLRQHVSGASTNRAETARTNGPTPLQLSVTAFEALAKNFPQSPYYGKGQLGLGWCFLMLDKLPESQKAFLAAVNRLPPSADLAQAYFKLGDVQFMQKDFTNAILNYKAITDKFADLPEVNTNLLERALYQAARAGIAAGDSTAATNALQKIMAWYPNGFHTDRAVLLAGQELSRQGDSAAARKIFSDFVTLAPSSPLRPEVDLAIARTYEKEDNWKLAIGQYDAWLNTFTNHEARPRAEFFRARANYRVGETTNALVQFTNLVARFPTNEWAPLAQLWVANYYFQTGDFTRAEHDFQLLYRSRPDSELAFQAYMMAGRAAVGRQSWKDASTYFTNLYNNPNYPIDLRLEALYAHGDCLMNQGSTNQLADYAEALVVFKSICENNKTNAMAVLAWGQRANCDLQLAQVSQDYTAPSNDFQEVLNSSLADATARSIAKVGLGVVLEKQAQQKTGLEQTALLRQARDHYLDVFQGKFLREAEKPSPFWTKEAGLRAARLAETMQDWSVFINLGKQLADLSPQLRPALEKRINTAQEKVRATE